MRIFSKTHGNMVEYIDGVAQSTPIFKEESIVSKEQFLGIVKKTIHFETEETYVPSKKEKNPKLYFFTQKGVESKSKKVVSCMI